MTSVPSLLLSQSEPTWSWIFDKQQECGACTFHHNGYGIYSYWHL